MGIEANTRTTVGSMRLCCDCATMIGSAAGLVVPQRDVPAVAPAVVKIWGFPLLAGQLGRTGAAWVAAVPGPDEHADSYRHIDWRVLDRRSEPG